MTFASGQQPPSPTPERIPLSRRGQISSYGQGRTCGSPACETLLSRYNKDALCWTHAGELEASKLRA